MFLINLRFQFLFGLLLFFGIKLGAQCSYEAHFRLDGNPADSSIHQNHGTFFGGNIYAVHDRFNNANGAVYFDGVDDYINTFTTYDLQERTVSFWFYAMRTSGINALIAHDANNLSYGAFSANIENGDLRARAGGTPTYSIQMPIAAHTWHHLTLVRRTDSVFFYLNGNFILKGPSNSNGSAFQAYNKLVIGAHRSRSQDFFKGRMDDLKIFNCAFDQSQVDSLFQDTTGITISPCTQGYWPFEGNIRDTSGYGNHGTFHGAPQLTLDRNGNPNGAYEFDGVDDYIHTNATYEFEQRTGLVWFYPYEVNANRVVFIQDANWLNYGAFNVSIHADGSLRSRAGNTGGTIIYPNLTPNEWYHVAIVRRPDSCFYYVNGVQTATSFASSGGSFSQANDQLVIGVGREENVKFFKGKIDEVKVIACDLNEFEIDSIYQQEYPQPPCVIGYWPFDGNTNDSTIYENDAVSFGGPATYAADRFGNPNGAISFDGADDYLDTYATYDYEERSIGFWFYAERTSNDIVLGQDDNNLNYGGLSAGFNNGQLRGRAGGSGASTIIPNVSLNNWYHVVMVRTASTNYYYLNGQLVSSSPSNSSGSASQAYDKLIFGAHRSRNQRFFKGRLDDVWISACPLDSNEVDSVYQAQLPIPVAGLPNDTTLCPGDSLQIVLPLNPGINYVWDDNSTSNTRLINQAGTYWVEATSFSDTLLDTIVVDYYDLPQGLGIDTAICGPATFTVDYSGTIADSLLWSDGSNSLVRNFNADTNLTISLFGPCGVVIDTFNLEVVDVLIPRITDTILCPATSLTLGHRSATGYQFLWSTGSTQNQISVNSSGTYWLRAILPCDTVVDTFYVSDAPVLPDPQIADSLYICDLGDSLLIGELVDTSISFQWSNGAANSTQWVSETGVYTLNLDNGCTAKNLNYNVVDLSRFEPEPFEDTTLCTEQTIYQDFNQWPVTGVRVNGNLINDGLYLFEMPGIYSIEYIQPCGVWADEFTLRYETCDCDLLMADAFTPNGDGLNDVYAIKSACTNFDYDIEIFNRWGISVFRNDNPDDFWDGTLNGKAVPGGVFVYKITYSAEINGRKVEKFEQGTIRLYR